MSGTPVIDQIPIDRSKMTIKQPDMRPTYSLATLSDENPEVQHRIDLANEYLSDSSGASLYLTGEQFSTVTDCIHDNRGSLHFSHTDLAEFNSIGFEHMENSVRASTATMQAEVRAVGSLVEACHADTVTKLNVLQSSIQRVNDNVMAVGQNVATVSKALTELRRDFQQYLETDARANNIQRAETKLVQLNQKLESDFGHNKQLRRTAVGILQAADMQAIRPNTILSSAEQLCVQTPNYWLAPALVALAKWVELSQSALSRDKLGAHSQVITNMLNEAYRRERAKTALFFGMICRRANNLTRAHEWFMEYLSYQQPETVDHTCTAFLNMYAGGLMGHGREEQEASAVLASWRDKLMADPEGQHVKTVVNDWKNTCQELYLKGAISQRTYTALPAFCTQAWAVMQNAMQASSLHREMRGFLETELSRKDFAASDTELLDSIIANLVTSYDADELPIRREQEYEKLIIDLEGDMRLAGALRGIKDDILSETKSFMSILSDAARSSDLTAASAATHVLSIKMQMPWIKQAYEETTAEYRTITPNFIPIEVGGFEATTTDGSNEEKVVSDFIAFVNEEERAGLEASKPGTLQMVALVGGAILAVLGFVLTFAVGAGWGLIAILGLAAAIYGFMSGKKAREKQAALSQNMALKRQYGTLVLRKVMQEVRDWRNDYAINESFMADNVKNMDSYIIDAPSAL